LAFKQSDVKINGHSVEYRVYAEDPSRKFLPSIGFLEKYKEPAAHKQIRIDTGVEEGSEISMYYDPMISKLITWDETRDKAMIMLGDAMDEYVIRGVTHNVGFGRSILRNNDFRSGNYSTAFIPTFYPKGFFGDPLSFEDHSHLAISAYFLKNKENQHAVLKGQDLPEESKTVYVSLHDISDTNYQITRLSDKEFEVKTLPSGESTKVNVDNFNVEYDALIRFGVNG